MLASTSGVVLDYIRTFIWPCVVVGLLLYFLIEYRENVRGLIDAISELRGPGGTGAVVGPRQQPPPPSIDQVKEEAQNELLEQVVQEYEQQLEQAQVHQQELLSDLIRARLELDFERLYQWIFGSQMRALRALRAAGGQLPREALEPFFQVAQAELPPDWTFEQWVSYLLNPGYIGPLVEQVDAQYQLTQKGQAFLGYTEMLGYPERAA